MTTPAPSQNRRPPKKRQAIQMMRDAGWVSTRTVGSHMHWTHPETGGHVAFAIGNLNHEVTKIEWQNIKRALGGIEHPKRQTG